MLPTPLPTSLSAPFWEATGRGELRLQRCDRCGAFRFPPKVLCPACLGEPATWAPVRGSATLVSHTVVHQPATPAFAGRVPYVVAVVQLAEGPRMLTNLVDCDARALSAGMPLHVAFEARVSGTGQTVMLPVFRPVAG